ncbi:hypothetical protein ANCCEY_00421 [Ancylostoma ceylanicum]|uniref:Uncharacterized protein n=1 Tax=Ancylostoma ceylanicum TaxID=53326 RepID=A0A0D6M8N8_9BILA|nr:hypothetical protein ANCCEY_00421 [Ancylostoma ceylanicum]
MLRRFAPCTLRAAAECSYSRRAFSVDIDHSHEKPAPFQLEHIQTRLVETVPLMFKQRLDYTFYRKDVFCDDQIFGLKKHGIDQLMQHFGTISVLAQATLPHVHMELSWFDGYSVLTVDGNGLVFKITLQKTQRDEGMLLDEKSAKDKLAEKIAVFRPGPAATNFVPRRRSANSSDDKD